VFDATSAQRSHVFDDQVQRAVSRSVVRVLYDASVRVRRLSTTQKRRHRGCRRRSEKPLVPRMLPDGRLVRRLPRCPPFRVASRVLSCCLASCRCVDSILHLSLTVVPIVAWNPRPQPTMSFDISGRMVALRVDAPVSREQAATAVAVASFGKAIGKAAAAAAAPTQDSAGVARLRAEGSFLGAGAGTGDVAATARLGCGAAAPFQNRTLSGRALEIYASMQRERARSRSGGTAPLCCRPDDDGGGDDDDDDDVCVYSCMSSRAGYCAHVASST
jgi:hypothetical protein